MKKTANYVTYSNLVNFARAFSDPSNGVKSITDENLKKFDTLENRDCLVNLASALYNSARIAQDMREKMGFSCTKEEQEKNFAILQTVNNDLRIAARNWFFAFGYRKSADKVKALYLVTEADFVTIGDICGQALEKAPVKTVEKFLELMMLATVRIIDGKPLGRVPDEDIKKIMKEANEKKVAKAKATKEANEKKAKEQSKKDKELEEKTAQVEALSKELAELKARSIDLVAILKAVRESHATKEEQDYIVSLLIGENEQEEKPVDEAKEEQPKEEEKPVEEASVQEEVKAEEKPVEEKKPSTRTRKSGKKAEKKTA